MEPHTRTIRERVAQKCEMLVDRVEFIDLNFSKEVLTDRILRKAMYKEFQEAVEAAADICALVRRSLDSSAQDDYSNVDYLVDRDIVSADGWFMNTTASTTGLHMPQLHGSPEPCANLPG
ncbi:MAG: DUF86 domain-containing protein [Methanoculleus horonobensis]|nr:DUF86 domain-containing protein [Methanoculleus horonobensis]